MKRLGITALLCILHKGTRQIHAKLLKFALIFLTFTYRSVVLLSTRGEIKQLNISDSLIPLGLAKPAHLSNKGLCLYSSTKFLGGQQQPHFYGEMQLPDYFHELLLLMCHEDAF